MTLVDTISDWEAIGRLWAESAIPPSPRYEFVRNYPTRVQAQAFIDGQKDAGVNLDFKVEASTDRHSPTGAWYAVLRERRSP